jgi:predicted TIM-barrel enzyme
VKVEDRGLEHTRKVPGNSVVFNQGSAKCGAIDARDGLNDPRLEAVIDAWPNLSESVRSDILAMVEAAR